ncbi:MAG: hypothetical protein NVS3B2_10860 [Ramlibacter sp.]
MSHTDSRADSDLERLARRRARARMGWLIHASVYAIVNLLLLALAFLSGRQWVAAPALAWGLGLAIHGIAVFLRAGGAGLHQRLLQRERARLSMQRDPW